jgi:hypothetical protein
MNGHRFRIGEKMNVSLAPYHPGKVLACTVMQLLPFEDGAFQYRIKSADEDFERIASEKDLTALAGNEPAFP